MYAIRSYYVIVVGMVVAVLDGLGVGALADDEQPGSGEVPAS